MHPSTHALAETLTTDRRREAAQRREMKVEDSTAAAAPRWWRLGAPAPTLLAASETIAPHASA